MKFVISIILFALFFSCKQNNENQYIDFIKIEDQTYVGIEEIQTNLDVPWDIQYSPTHHSLFMTEIKGDISILDLKTNALKKIYTVPNVFHRRTSGLLGMVLHPDFEHKPFIYISYTIAEGENRFSQLAKLTYENGEIVNHDVLLKIEGANGHNGARLIFDNNGYLYWATGDANSKTHSQDSTTLNGKVLRMTDDGKIPADNPIKDSYVYAWGFRNIQGLTFTSKGNIISAEHGDAIEDEINWVRPLKNYGWIDIEGYHDTAEEKKIASRNSREEPIKAWTPVIAPAGIKYYHHNNIAAWSNSILLVTLKSQSLRVLKLNEDENTITNEHIYLKDHYGRLRAVTTDNDGNIYIATSNQDWNPQTGFPKKSDDRILKLSKIDFVPQKFLEEYKEDKLKVKDGKELYTTYCASCHKDDAQGIKGTFPPLVQTEKIKDKDKFIHTILNGLNEKINVNGVDYDQPMPAFNFLSDEDVAKIASYIRTGFGNSLSAIGSTEVLIVRSQSSKK